MDRIEELIRESLQTRAQDVEPTPALWLEVDRRVARRKRFQVVTWSLAGATAALAGVLVVPAIVSQVGGSDPLEIAPLDRVPVGGDVPAHVMAVGDDGVARLVDLAGGERLRDLAELPFEPVDLAVTPTSTIDAVEFAAVATSGEVAVVGADGTSWSSEDGNAPRDADSVVASPDGRWFASTTATEESDGASVVVAPPLSSWEPGVAQAWSEVGMVVDPATRLVSWSGEASEEGDRSTLWLVTGDGTLVREGLEVIDGVPTSLGSGSVDEHGERVLDAATSFAASGADGEASYLLVDDAGGPALVWRGADGSVSTSDLSEVVGDVDPALLWLDAKQDGAVVGDGVRTWFVAHDGQGDFAEAVELDEGAVRAALLDAPRPGRADDEPEPEPTEEPVEEPVEEPAEEPVEETVEEPAPDGGVVDGVALPAPVVTVTERDLVLHGPDGEQVLYTLPYEGESTFLAARVRPGSTVDDLTVVALHRAEGMQDFRTYRYVAGELSVQYWDGRPDLQPGFGGQAGDAAAAYGPVWSPAGDKLAWIELGTGGTPVLRIIGWQDGPGTGEPATDNASWSLDALAGDEVEPFQWVDLGGGRTEIQGTIVGSNGWFAIPVEIQGDGAPALPAGETGQRRTSGGEAPVLGLAGTMDGGSPRWMLRGEVVVLDPAGEARTVASLPPGTLPGEGLPDVWMRPAGDGVVVGVSNTGSAFYVTPDGQVASVADDAVMDGDVVS
ncbi:hypothetical protein [Egicoccus sp. AB-alg2]|uniref:hypothetical protein n=1 Tax=Egicoccus sp. AB-alg2 TaxID=3242693 RepID=UPI00359DA8CB